MDLAYSFWCSRCKKDHSGECPPTDLHSLNVARHVSVGSRWKQEDRQSDGRWRLSPSGSVWRVVHIPLDAAAPVDIISESTGCTFKAPREVFTDEGTLTTVLPSRWRMVPLFLDIGA